MASGLWSAASFALPLTIWQRLSNLNIEENPLEFEFEDNCQSRIANLLPRLRVLNKVDLRNAPRGPQTETIVKRKLKEEDLKRKFALECQRLEEDQSMLLEFGRKYMGNRDYDEVDRLIQEIDERTAEMEEEPNTRQSNIRVKRVDRVYSRGGESVDRRPASGKTGRIQSFGSVAPRLGKQGETREVPDFREHPKGLKNAGRAALSRGFGNFEADSLAHLEADLRRPMQRGHLYSLKNAEPAKAGRQQSSNTGRGSKLVGFGAKTGKRTYN